MKAILTFLIVFSVVVIIHEFGHFFFARRARILVREFAIGMGPKIFSHRGKDGTTYTIRALPMGGYVRMAGLGDDETELNPGMPISLVQNANGRIMKINTSKKVQLTNGIPMELESCDLEDALTITGYINGDDSQTVTYPVMHDATIIEQDGTEIRIAPRDVQFQSAKLSQRILTNFAGPLNNFILALVLFILIVFMQGGVADPSSNQIGQVVPDGVAAEVGLKAGDEVVAIDGKKMENWEDLTTEISANPDKPLEFKIQRGDKVFTQEVTPAAEKEGETTVGKLGIQVPMKTGVVDKLTGGFTAMINSSLMIFKALGNLIMQPNLDKLGGPVAMFQMSSQAAEQGPITVLTLMAVISVNLGIFNLLPIPALDGGKLVMNLIEGIRGKPLSQEKEGLLTLVGFGFLMLLMILVTWNDIQRYFF